MATGHKQIYYILCVYAFRSVKFEVETEKCECNHSICRKYFTHRQSWMGLMGCWCVILIETVIICDHWATPAQQAGPQPSTIYILNNIEKMIIQIFHKMQINNNNGYYIYVAIDKRYMVGARETESRRVEEWATNLFSTRTNITYIHTFRRGICASMLFLFFSFFFLSCFSCCVLFVPKMVNNFIHEV